MSTATTTNNLLNQILRDGKAAANADNINIALHEPDPSHTATGWDSFEVWRKFIKEAREKRQAL